MILLKCETFVTFSIVHELKTHKLQLYGGSVIVDRQFLVESENNDTLSKGSTKAHDFRKFFLLIFANFESNVFFLSLPADTDNCSIFYHHTMVDPVEGYFTQ